MACSVARLVVGPEINAHTQPTSTTTKRCFAIRSPVVVHFACVSSSSHHRAYERAFDVCALSLHNLINYTPPFIYKLINYQSASFRFRRANERASERANDELLAHMVESFALVFMCVMARCNM